MLAEFKKFAMRGNVVDMAVGIIIGGAFGKIVSSLVNDVIMPPIGMAMGGVDFSDLAIALGEGEEAASINYGLFINNVLDFLIVAVVVLHIENIVDEQTVVDRRVRDLHGDQGHEFDEEERRREAGRTA